jgi:hypothetical protein
LQSAIQRRQRDGAPIRLEVILEFARQLVHNTLSRDALALAVYAARDRTGASDEEMTVLLEAVQSEHAAFNVWPKGF